MGGGFFQKPLFFSTFLILVGFLSMSGLSGCTVVKQVDDDDPATAPVIPANLVASSWSPNVTGVSSAVYKQGTFPTVKSVITVSGAPMVRFNDPWAVGSEVTVDLGAYDATDFGANGSIALVAETKNYPYSAGGAYPVLISFYVDTGGGTREFVNTIRNGNANDCRQSGMYVCVGSSCSTNSSCTVASPSSFSGSAQWTQHQIQPYGYSSTNRFPMCQGAVGQPWSVAECPATVSGAMPTGHYYAKYVLMSDRSASVAGATATLQVTVQQKLDASARNTGATNGGLKLNVILVGDQNANAAATSIGAQNLNLLFGEVHNLLNANAGVGLANITAYDWTNAHGGSTYASVDLDDLGTMLQNGSSAAQIPSSDSGKAINVFIVSDIPYAAGGVTILGISGAILGPPLNGLQTSGLVFSSFDQLATFNPLCTLGSCSRVKQESDFLEMAATIAHELGHFVGLNHPSERRSAGYSQTHDSLTDTPQCIARVSGGSYVLDHRACFTDNTSTVGGQTCPTACPNYLNGSFQLNTFCSSVTQCQFNHIMWYTTKNRRQAVAGVSAWEEDGSLLSDQSSAIVQWNSFVQ